MILEKGIHSMETPRNCTRVLDLLLEEAGFDPSLVKIKLGPKIECSDLTPTLKIGQITPRGSVEIKLKPDDNYSRHLFFMFPPSGCTAHEVHSRLTNAVNILNDRGESKLKSHTSEVLDKNRNEIMTAILDKTKNGQVSAKDLNDILVKYNSHLHRVGAGLCSRGLLSRDKIGLYNVLFSQKDIRSTARKPADPVVEEPVSTPAETNKHAAPNFQIEKLESVVSKGNLIKQRLAGAEQYIEYSHNLIKIEQDIEDIKQMLYSAEKQRAEYHNLLVCTQDDYDFLMSLDI